MCPSGDHGFIRLKFPAFPGGAAEGVERGLEGVSAGFAQICAKPSETPGPKSLAPWQFSEPGNFSYLGRSVTIVLAGGGG